MSNALEEIKGIYSKFIVSDDGQTGELPLDDKGQWTLKAVKSENPDNWKVHDAVTDEFFNMPSRGIPAALRMTAGEFICTYKDLMPKNPIDNLKAGGFDIASEPAKESYPIESFEEPDKLAQLDAIMDGEATVPEPQKWNNGGAKALTKKQYATRMPATIPENIRSKQIAALTQDEIKNYLCPTATDQEAYMFLQLCQARNLNPFLNEAYLIKFGNKATMVVGKEAYMRRAESHPEFDGFEAGIIIKNDTGVLERREGTFLMKGETLVGGWAKIYRKDRSKPYVSEVSLDEYNSKQSLWISKPATMIRKVAIVQGKREAFPSEFGGMYDAAEMGGEVIEAVYEVGA